MRMFNNLSTTTFLGMVVFGSTVFAQHPADSALADKLTAPQAIASSNCGPGIDVALRGQYGSRYASLVAALSPNTYDLAQLLDDVTDVSTYNALVNFSVDLARSIPDGRLLIALPDGTVVVDTAEPIDFDNRLPRGNSYQHYQNKTVNENHNTRVAIMSAQQWPCGIGVESKPSTTTGTFQSYVALRLGTHLQSSGTARLSVIAPQQTLTTATER